MSMATEKSLTDIAALNSATRQWVTFRLDNETYGIGVLRVREVLRMTDITPVPGAPSSVEGIINLRGVVVTIVDGRRHFSLSPKAIDQDTRIIIVDLDDESMVGIVVDSVSVVVDLADTDIDLVSGVGSDESSKYIHGVANRNDDLLILIDLDKLFDKSELAIAGSDDLF
jgi:purine-binding chemotaxis protein CheW